MISVEFESDSQLEIMDENAFSVISIGSITIPSSVSRIEKSCFDKCSKLKRVDFLPEFKRNWCYGVSHLTDIIIMESENEEPNVIYYENKFLLAKSDTNSDAFDVLVFARRDIDDVVVPSFIKTIVSSAFGDCIKLKKNKTN
ncbi:hypothetical protein M9Y10_008655 [Tritrichomonas musculus]|uniref:Uncharacterized protein n=1 Tax=Tritrichomonas musculus TaxID=1915356 RepID=A0ABR2IYR2_9EUKA